MAKKGEKISKRELRYRLGVRKQASDMHKQRFVTSLFENFNISIAKEFATFYKQTRTAWLSAQAARPPALPPDPTSEQIRQHGFATRALQKEVHICWQQMMTVLQQMMRYSLPTFKSQEVKVSTSKRAVFNINIGAGPGVAPSDEDDVVNVTPEPDPPSLPQ